MCYGNNPFTQGLMLKMQLHWSRLLLHTLTTSNARPLSRKLERVFAQDKNHICLYKSIPYCQHQIAQTICTERSLPFPRKCFTLTGKMKIQDTLFLQTEFRFVSHKRPHSNSPHTVHATKEWRCFLPSIWVISNTRLSKQKVSVEHDFCPVVRNPVKVS